MENLKLLWAVIKFLPEKRKYLLYPVSFLILANILSLTIPLLSMRVIDSLRTDNYLSGGNILLLMLAWILAAFLVVILEYLQNFLFRRYGDNVAGFIFQKKMERSLQQGFREWNTNDAKKSADMIKKDIEDIYPLLCGLPFLMIRHILIAAISILVIVYINVKLSAAITVLVPFYIAVYTIKDKKIRSSYWLTRKTGRDLWQKMVEYLQSVPLIMYSGSAGKANRVLMSGFKQYLSAEFAFFKYIQKRRIWAGILSSAVPVYLAFIAFLFLAYDLATVGQVFGFWGLFGLAIGAINSFTGQYTGVLKSLAVFSTIPVLKMHSPELPLQKISVRSIQIISCKNLGLAYNNDSHHFISFPAFEIKRGQIVRIAGRSGSGKTTLLRMILGLIRPDQGRVLINGKDRHLYEDISFFNQIGYVEQDGYIYSATIRENILLGRDFDPNRWHSVVTLTALMPVLDQKGLEQIGENGVCLSGGERQRILIARALYGKPQWLFLDEPFRGIDDDTKMDIVTLLQSLEKQITIVLVTHAEKPIFSGIKCIFLE